MDELGHRRTNRAKELTRRVMQALGVAPGKTEPEPSISAPHNEERAASSAVSLLRKPQADPKPVLRKPSDTSGLTEPERVMLAWAALEVLSPAGFNKPEALVGNDRSRTARFGDGGLPWESGGERSKPNYRLYYQIVPDSIAMEPAIAALLKVYTDQREERPSGKKQSIVAIITVDKTGRMKV